MTRVVIIPGLEEDGCLFYCVIFFFSVNTISEAQLVSSAGQNASTFLVYIDIKKEGSCVL